MFSYLYVRPLIRRRLGSASRGYINYQAIYIAWLMLAVFYHLPSLESMGESACAALQGSSRGPLDGCGLGPRARDSAAYQ